MRRPKPGRPRQRSARPQRRLPSGLPPRSEADSPVETPRSAHPPAAEAQPNSPGQGERLQKVLASAGLGSRRKCEELIVTGRVQINGQVVAALGTRVSPEDEVRVDAQPIKTSRKVYYLLNKPVGVVCSHHDPAGRPLAIDLLPPGQERLFTVGRLDMSSEGLLLLTNDGELANQLAHPRFGVHKTYLAEVAGQPAPEVYARLRKGVHLAEGVARVVQVTVKRERPHSTILQIVLAEGKNREIRRILAQVGHKVLRLKRIAIGPLRMKDMAPGEHRQLHAVEVRALQRGAGGRRRGPRKPAAAKPPVKGASAGPRRRRSRPPRAKDSQS